MLQDETIVKDQETSAASQERDRRIEPEMQKESLSELRITEEPAPLSTTTSTTGSSENRKSGRLTKTVEKCDLSPGS